MGFESIFFRGKLDGPWVPMPHACTLSNGWNTYTFPRGTRYKSFETRDRGWILIHRDDADGMPRFFKY